MFLSAGSGAGDGDAGGADVDFVCLERLGRRAADVLAGVRVVDAAVAGAVDAVQLRLELDGAAEVGADGAEGDPGVVRAVDEHGGRAAELEHEGGGEREGLRLVERDLADGALAGGHLGRRGEIAVDGVADGSGVAEAGGGGDAEEGAAGGRAFGFFERGFDDRRRDCDCRTGSLMRHSP